LFLDATAASPEAGELSRPIEKDAAGKDIQDRTGEEKG
jgi:hypothetical protein